MLKYRSSDSSQIQSVFSLRCFSREPPPEKFTFFSVAARKKVVFYQGPRKLECLRPLIWYK